MFRVWELSFQRENSVVEGCGLQGICRLLILQLSRVVDGFLVIHRWPVLFFSCEFPCLGLVFKEKIPSWKDLVSKVFVD